ncbi:MAG: L-histidine Nalpha-methyltransferase, partial [Verrucomicrobiota bacterium]
VKQTQQWLALHQAYSPSRTDEDCAATYDKSFAAVTGKISASIVHVIGLGCGGGQKDTRLLSLLKAQGKEILYTPSDVSASMVLVARQAALAAVSEQNCFPLVCDLASAGDLRSVFEENNLGTATCRPSQNAARLVTFFGMIPNFEPEMILPKLASLVGPEDFLLFSANLAPGHDYAAGVKHILPLYDNALTRDWLLTFLLDLGVERADGELRFAIEDASHGLKRIVARFHFFRTREIQIENDRFSFRAGESVRLFFSYRHTPELVRRLLLQQGLNVADEWITKSKEEGVFLCQRKTAVALRKGR